MIDITEYKQRHKSFWNMIDTGRPLIGFTIGAGADSWSYWRYNSAVNNIFSSKNLMPENISPDNFMTDQLKYLEDASNVEDDICRSAMPFASIPWMEAIMGCPVASSGHHLTAEAIIHDIDSYEFKPFDSENKWVKKYLQFLSHYSENFGNRHPVAQSIIRGTTDLAAALMGVENSSMTLLTNPGYMQELFLHITGWIEQFILLQLQYIPKFRDGYVIGQYEIWAPEPAIRIQEDSSVLYSPELFDEFIKSLDTRLAAISNYTLMHLHSPALALIDNFLSINEIRAFQVTKDPGGMGLEEMMPGLITIQENSKPLIVKGEFSPEEINLLKTKLSNCGLCIQPVVKSVKEAESLIALFRNWT